VEDDTGDMDELIIATGRTENALNLDLINPASVSALLTHPFMTLSEILSYPQSTSIDPSCSLQDTPRVKKRRKYLSAKQMLDAKRRGEYEQVNLVMRPVRFKPKKFLGFKRIGRSTSVHRFRIVWFASRIEPKIVQFFKNVGSVFSISVRTGIDNTKSTFF